MALFKRKKKPQLVMTLTQGGQTIFSGPAFDYPFEEHVLVALAVQFYNDSAPCEIRRAAVRSRIWMEMEPLIPFGGPTESLPPMQQAYFPEGAMLSLQWEDP